ncbi:MAG: helix-turn-helix domain-containing protein [Oscillospiraceae bacterium]|jgi:transcriptional regulator with XRE-family HTH domain|nr:helix-turn-helix domain-containing protein [Oscillospiraceae bacterium]
MKTQYPERYKMLGLKIAYYRKMAEMTQEQFADKIDRSVSFIAQVEGTGTTRGVSLETLFRMAEALGIPPSKLLADD